MKVEATSRSRGSTPLWHMALEKYRDELQDAQDYEAIQGVHSLDELMKSMSTIQAGPGVSASLVTLKRLTPRLKFVDDFSAVLALCFGADTALTAAVWGSIRLILSHASSAAETLQDVLDMLEELSLTLPRFQVYERTLPLNRQLQQALIDVYGEIICFYARAIHFLRSNPHLVLRKNAWGKLQADFSRTTMRIKRMASSVESEADLARMRKDEGQYKEVLDLLGTMQLARDDESKRARYSNIPFSANAKFSGRDEVLATIHGALDPDMVASSHKSSALFGMGGVGKTQIALEYAYSSVHKFDIVMWVAADNAIAIGQSFRTIADGLGLLGDGGETNRSAAAIWKMKNWLLTTKSSCLVVFDNADDLAALKTAWPGATGGSVSMLLTTRDLTVATSFAAQSIHVNALGDDEGTKLLLRAIDVEDGSRLDTEQALAISRAFGGLPLALAQVAGFITQRRLALKDFLPLYERYSSRVDSRRNPGSDYEHTLSTVWDMSFQKLTETNSACLLNLLSFFEPDGISEDILINGSKDLDEEFLFLSDEFDLGDASEELMRAALVQRAAQSSDLSMHRLVQSAVRKKLERSTAANLFDVVVHMLCWGFPDHSSVDIGHQISAWARCETCLPHVHHLVGLSRSSGIAALDQHKYADLLLRCGCAIDLGGLLDLDLAQASRALGPFKRALEIRRARLGPEDPFIAYSLNNIALAYTEMGELELAHEAHSEAVRLRREPKSDRIGNSYSNLSSLLLRMGRPDEAEEMLARCPSLRDFTDETFLGTGNPRFSGDMVLLSRIRLAQGRATEAIRLASKALEFRRNLLGGRLKTCDSQYDVARMLALEEFESSAIQMLEEIVSISETFVEGQGQRARALYKLSEIYRKGGQEASSEDYKQRAMELRAAMRPELPDAPFEEEEFGKLCSWMLW
ncbi:hypothetical protein PspLS_03746 [Pyricularia sp. CBS 133598]|nr:hypothetical protein PspLS_03746 [Pyricularia sp. CBS 133598]